MAPRRLGGAQAPLEFGTPGGGGRILAQDQPFAISVIDAGAEAQTTLASPLGGQGLGRRQDQQQALTDPAEAFETVLLHDPLTTLGQLLEGSLAQKLLKLGLAEGRWHRGRRGKRRRRRGKQRCRGGLEYQGR